MSDRTFVFRALAAVALAVLSALYLIRIGIEPAFAVIVPALLAVFLLLPEDDDRSEPPLGS